jgi:hypothetical protein
MLFTIPTIGLICHFGPILFLLCSCPSSKCFPCSIRPPLLRSLCADGTSPPVSCLHMKILHGANRMKKGQSKLPIQALLYKRITYDGSRSTHTGFDTITTEPWMALVEPRGTAAFAGVRGIGSHLSMWWGAPSTESIEGKGYTRTYRSGKGRFSTLERRLSRQALLLGEMHMLHTRMGQQLLGVAPENLLSYLGLEGVQGIKIFHPALGGDKGIIRAEQDAIL